METILEEKEETEGTPKILYCGFNQDNTCFACGTTSGFCIFQCDPFHLTFQRKFTNVHITYIEMLYRCNLLALVGSGSEPFSPKKVIIWDDNKTKAIGELSFRSEVKAVKLSRTRIVVVLQEKTYVYNFADLKLLDFMETFSNLGGLVSLESSTNTLATLGLTHGHVRVDWYGDERKTQLIIAHQTPIATLYVNEGKLATASERGTLIRLWNAKDGILLHEFRRGSDVANFYSLSFNTKWVICSTNKSTIHIFHNNSEKNTRSRWSFLAGVPYVGSYIGGQWSYVQCNVPSHHCHVMITDTMVFVIGADDAMFYKIQLDPETATCSILCAIPFFV